MSWFYAKHLADGGEPCKCFNCKQPMVAEPSPTRPSDINRWICPDCEINMGKQPEVDLAVDELIHQRGFARRILDGWRAIF